MFKATPDQERQMLDALKRMGDKIVQLGYAEHIKFEDDKQTITVAWTPAGKSLRFEIGRIFESVAKSEGEIDVLEIKALFAIFIRTNSEE